MGGITVTFPDGSTLPVGVRYTTGQHPPQNTLSTHTVTLGTRVGEQVVITLTPGAVVPPTPPSPPPPPPSGPQAITLAAGMVPITHYTNPVKSYVFNGTSLPADWSVHNGDDGYATTDYDASGVSFDGTNVCLTISKTANPEGLTYTSGMVETAGVTFSHGQFDCVIPQVPQEMGMWPAFWLIGATNIEIDGMESISPDYDTVHGTIHASDGGAEQGFSTSVDTSKPVTYSIVWEPGIITFAANGQAYGQATAAQWNNPTWHPGAWDFDSAALWLRLNLGMSYPGGWGSPPDSTTVLPAVMKVQSVKVYQ